MVSFTRAWARPMSVREWNRRAGRCAERDAWMTAAAVGQARARRTMVTVAAWGRCPCANTAQQNCCRVRHRAAFHR
jgi:hypothetical protein